ncbi:synaptotagmin 1-like [Pollicipes pollicipes]|uniref:synaptotagmin 1-like n=1 Tax=Pollicipes pollicipes TaxID=41117 RepID=UPI0018856664|nr:synaptotagmin 1-like [Pollicipes pollicipes]
MYQQLDAPPKKQDNCFKRFGILILALCFCCIRRCLSPFRSNDGNTEDEESGERKVNRSRSASKGKDSGGQESGDDALDGGVGDSSDQSLGRIHFKLEYDFNAKTLTVVVIRCEGLPALDVGGTSDPYVKIYLLPEKKKKHETKVQKNTLNPVFNQTFTFKMPYADVINKTLVFAIFDFDRFSKHDQIGEVQLPLCNVDLANVIEEWRNLVSVESDAELEKKLGDICFSIRYVPTSGKLTIVILEAKNLKKMDVTGLSDPYVKVELMLGKRKPKKKKTSVKSNTLNPYFNESLSFDKINRNQIEKVKLVVTVVDYDRIGSSDPIGRCVLGSMASGAELRHWTDMLAAPRRPIAAWHTLQDPEPDE